MSAPFVFVEGDTEKNVVIHLMKRVLGLSPESAWEERLRNRKGGKERIVPAIRDELGPEIGAAPVRCLVMRDVDADEGETLGSVRQSVEDALRRSFRARGYPDEGVAFSIHASFPNVFTYQSDAPDLRLGLHVAHYPPVPGLSRPFVKSTTDDYVLSLALQPQTTARLLRDIGLDIDGRCVTEKVCREIPELLRQNGIQAREAKDYVRIYLATVRLGMSPAVFADKLLHVADDEAIRRAFASLVATARFILGQEGET